MENSRLERDAEKAKNSINDVVSDLISEVEGLEMANMKLADKIDELEDEIERLKAELNEK